MSLVTKVNIWRDNDVLWVIFTGNNLPGMRQKLEMTSVSLKPALTDREKRTLIKH